MKNRKMVMARRISLTVAVVIIKLGRMRRHFIFIIIRNPIRVMLCMVLSFPMVNGKNVLNSMDHEAVTAKHVGKNHLHPIEQQSVSLGLGDIESEPFLVGPNQGSVPQFCKFVPEDLAGDEVVAEKRREVGEVVPGVSERLVKWGEEGEFTAGAGGGKLEVEEEGDEGEAVGTEEAGGVGEGVVGRRGAGGGRVWFWRGGGGWEVEVGVEEVGGGEDGEVGVVEDGRGGEGDVVDGDGGGGGGGGDGEGVVGEEGGDAGAEGEGGEAVEGEGVGEEVVAEEGEGELMGEAFEGGVGGGEDGEGVVGWEGLGG